MDFDSVSLVVQHAPSFWKSFNLDDYRSGGMMQTRETGGSLAGSASGIGAGVPVNIQRPPAISLAAPSDKTLNPVDQIPTTRGNY
jgi:hypothetical protein